MLTAPGVYPTYFGQAITNNGPRGLVGGTPESDQTVALFQENGRLVSTQGGIDLPDYTGTEGDAILQALAVSDGTSALGPLAGIAYAGAGDFVAYMLGVGGDPTEPFYLIYGTPTDEAALVNLDEGTDIRRYTLTRDPIQDLPVPFFNNDLYQGGFEPGTYNSSDLLVIENGLSETADVRAFQSWVSIEGEGTSQKSAAFLYTGNVFVGEDGHLRMGGARRGTFRHDAVDRSFRMGGGLSTIPGAGGAHLFGPNADNFVLGTPIDPPDAMFDGFFSDDSPDGYLRDGAFSTHHVADLTDESDQSGFTRSSRQLNGFMAGMGEANDGGSPYRLSSGLGDPNLRVDFNQVDNAFRARATVRDANDDNDVVRNLLLTFGHFDGDTGSSAYIDDTYYGARQNNNPENTRLRTDGTEGLDLAHVPDQNPGSYIVSGRANPIQGYQHLEGCSTCDFIEWGWWGTSVDTVVNGGDPEERRDIVHMGTWVAGELTDPADLASTLAAELPFGGSAHYSGTALGSVARDTGESIAQYIARGNFDMTYDFVARNGEFILNFDGENAFGPITDNVTTPTGHFTGSLGDGTVNGTVAGNFVDDGGNVAAGVIGDFTIGNQDMTMSAVGTFAGVEGPGR